MVLNFLKIDMF